MTPEEARKEQAASKMKQTEPIQQIKTEPEQLQTPQKLDTTPPAESDREYGNKVKDYKEVVSEAKAKGIDLNNQEGIPLLDSDKERIIQNASKLAPKELVTDVVNRINTYAQPEFKKVPELDQKRLMEQERRARKARWGDALYAFGEGLQGKTANPELYASNRIQRKQDQEFQNYQAVTEQNRIARNAWNAQTTNETIKWLDEQANNERLDKITREKMASAADQFRQKLDLDKDKVGETKRHNRAMENKKTGKALEKDLPVTIQTAKNTYQLKPEEAAFIKGEVMKNSEAYREKYPGWFEKVQKTNDFGNPIEGEFSYKLSPRIKDQDLIRAYLEDHQDSFDPNQVKSGFPKFNQSKNNIEQQHEIRGEADKTQPTNKVKADPLGLGL